MRYFEVAILTGDNPDDIRAEWDEGTINNFLLVHYAQQQARIALANKYKTDVGNIVAPTSITVRDENSIGRKKRR